MDSDRAKVARLRADAKKRGLKRCPACGRARRRGSFYRHAGNSDGLGSVCRDCHRASGREYHRRQRAAETPTHVSWRKMIDRCEQPSQQWEHYGARGIRVCDSWRQSFKAFLSDMGERPEGKTLDRIDVDGNYEPGNCRWATPKEQAANKRPRP